MIDKIREKFAELFGQSGSVYTAPGRVNIIGEHTDYNGGYVLPGAIDKSVIAEIKLNRGSKCRLYSIDFDQYVEFGIVDDHKAPKEQWAKYIFGLCREIIVRGGHLGCFDSVFAGDVPLGAGMSSSAALESTYAFALNDMLRLNFEPMELARIGQATEHNYLGVKCGIMDQFASIHGRQGQLMKLDCKSGQFTYIPLDAQSHHYKICLVDSCVKHQLVDSPYNRRRESCERAVFAISQTHPEVEFLRDAKLEWLDRVIGQITQHDYIRARYAIEEIDRLQEACAALERGDFKTLGDKMYATHVGLSVLYEVSCEELDFLTQVARDCGVAGSRLMGGGFGGCTINLVHQDRYDQFVSSAKERYAEKFGIQCKVYPVVISDGARRLY